MPRRLGSTEIIRLLEANGFVFVSQRGSHGEIPECGRADRDYSAPEARDPDRHNAVYHPAIGSDAEGVRFLSCTRASFSKSPSAFGGFEQSLARYGE
jgi:hypothetical protein